MYYVYKLKVQIYQTSIAKVWIETVINIKKKKKKRKDFSVFGRPANIFPTILFCRLRSSSCYSRSVENRRLGRGSARGNRFGATLFNFFYFFFLFYCSPTILIVSAFVLVNNNYRRRRRAHTHTYVYVYRTTCIRVRHTRTHTSAATALAFSATILVSESPGGCAAVVSWWGGGWWRGERVMCIHSSE